MIFKLFTFLFVLSLLCISGCKDNSTNPPAGYITRLTKILDKPGDIVFAQMSNDKRSIIYVCRPAAGNTEVWMCDTDGSNDRLLFNESYLINLVIQSPDGKSLMIWGYLINGTIFYHYNLTNGTNYLWHSSSYPEEEYIPKGFTADGKSLLVTSSRRLSTRISSINMETKEVTVLSESSYGLGVSNSGSKIVYLKDGIGLHIMNSDGSNKKLLLDIGWFGTVAFTPNDNIFYYAAIDHTPEIYRNRLYKIDVNTGSANMLMEDDTTGGGYVLHDVSRFDGSLLASYAINAGAQIVMINKGGNYHPLIDDPRKQLGVGFTSIPRQAIIRIMDEDMTYNLYKAEY